MIYAPFCSPSLFFLVIINYIYQRYQRWRHHFMRWLCATRRREKANNEYIQVSPIDCHSVRVFFSNSCLDRINQTMKQQSDLLCITQWFLRRGLARIWNFRFFEQIIETFWHFVEWHVYQFRFLRLCRKSVVILNLSIGGSYMNRESTIIECTNCQIFNLK